MTIENEAAIERNMDSIRRLRDALTEFGLNRADSQLLIDELENAARHSLELERGLTELRKQMDRGDIDRAEMWAQLREAMGDDTIGPTKH